ncbi:ATP-dependent Clp protease adaptor protein ClpS [Dyadobacter jejuensis]|uniref:ATP-dependent Clp protease adaptor protein ClpS n=2 Tax=Dyadobacter jejuensis TaxID=1082580 RepID=A0A316AAU3_9BACT|nr:ATP-dependent Clp protease adaptor ClpS [Dyadobacter jejuensis]PWJ54529.1 ATP-dependent Clp protease adaptor protein ClpS [Dyadobacter jejuensis]
MQIDIETDEQILEDTVAVDMLKLVIYNDDVNTFDWVIDTLMEVCGHTSEQAEQCTIIIHYKGKCSVKEGEFGELLPMRNSICERGISAEIH